MAPHSSTLAWKIPWMEEPGGLQSMGSLRVGNMNRGAWWATAHGVAKSQTPLSDFTFTFHFHALEKEMATHSIVLAWRIPGTGEPGGLLSMGFHRVGYDWSNLAAAAAALPHIFVKMCKHFGWRNKDWDKKQKFPFYFIQIKAGLRKTVIPHGLKVIQSKNKQKDLKRDIVSTYTVKYNCHHQSAWGSGPYIIKN